MTKDEELEGPKLEVLCDYCGKAAELVTGADVYNERPDLMDILIYRCEPCNARVGCHKGTTRPLGRLADPELRAAKMRAHTVFDELWRVKKGQPYAQSMKMRRKEAYAWLALEMKIDPDKCHIGMFDLEQCAAVLGAVKKINEYLDMGLSPPCPNCKEIDHCGVSDCLRCEKPMCECCGCNNMHFSCEATTTGGLYLGPVGALKMQHRFSACVFLVYRKSRWPRALLVKHKRIGLWLPVGGDLLPDEKPIDGAIREVVEETGFHLCYGDFIDPPFKCLGAPPGFIGYEEHEAGIKDGEAIYQMNFIFQAEVSYWCVNPSSEHSGYDWVPINKPLPEEYNTSENVRWCWKVLAQSR